MYIYSKAISFVGRVRASSHQLFILPLTASLKREEENREEPVEERWEKELQKEQERNREKEIDR